MDSVQSALRAVLAYIVGRLVLPRSARSVFDHAAGEIRRYGGEIAPPQVDIFDHQRHHHVAGTIRNGTLELYDYSSGRRLTCQVRGQQFTGIDHGSRHRYTGFVSGERLTLHDRDAGEQYAYDLR
jgi:hypothetical protein